MFSVGLSVCLSVVPAFQKFSKHGGVLALFAGQRTCDSQVVGSNPGWVSLGSVLGQATYTCVPLSPSSIIWYRSRGDLSGWESNHRPGGK